MDPAQDLYPNWTFLWPLRINKLKSLNFLGFFTILTKPFQNSKDLGPDLRGQVIIDSLDPPQEH
jgi:hypothetical protein